MPRLPAVLRLGSTGNVRRVWERVPLPEGLLLMGDSVQALNPAYGA